MRLTIIPSDNLVSIDGESRQVDCASFDSLQGVHAVQWDDPAGWIEYANSPLGGEFRPNEVITSVDQFQEVIDAWNAYVPPPPPEPPPPPDPPPPDPLVEAQRANARLDAGIDAAEETVVKLGKLPAIGEHTGEVTREEFDALTARVDAIQQAVTAMLDAQAAPV